MGLGEATDVQTHVNRHDQAKDDVLGTQYRQQILPAAGFVKTRCLVGLSVS